MDASNLSNIETDQLLLDVMKFSITIRAGTGTHPELCIIGAGSFQGLKRAGRGGDHPPTSSAEVKETENQCL